MSEAPLTDDGVSKPAGVMLSGYERKLENGAVVWMAKIPEEHGNGFAFRFTNKEGELTRLCLSEQAMDAVLALHSSITLPQSMAYRLLIKFADRIGEKVTDTAEAIWTPIASGELKKEPTRE